LFISQANHETPQPAGAPPGCGFTGSITSEFEDGSVEAAVSLLRQLAREQVFGARRLQEVQTHSHPCERSAPIQKLPPSPWRSLGGYFDYDQWADRERFMELDRAIAAVQHSLGFEREEFETEAEILTFRIAGAGDEGGGF
jgi:hypothetical protein